MAAKQNTNKELATQIIKQLRKNGYQAYLAGGCVRDMLLSRRAKDYDVATSAGPDVVVGLFGRTLELGAKFGVVMVIRWQCCVEVATFRTESGYIDGRHPEKVSFTDVQEDAKRRDFTINGLYYDPIEKKIIDFVDGRKDLDAKIIRAIGKPSERFLEDYLRMLRAVRFSSQLDFEIEIKTWRAICENSHRIVKISAERIATELEGLLTHPNRQFGIEKLIESGLGQAIFDGIYKKDFSFGAKTAGHLPKRIDFALSLTALFCKLDSDDALVQCRKLKLSRKQLKHIKFLLTNRSALLNENLPLAKLKMLAAEPYFNDLYELQKAIQRADGLSLSVLYKVKKRAQSLAGRELKPKPLIDGYEIIRLGARPGPQVGLVSQELYIAQLSEEVNTAEQAKKWVKNWLKSRNKIREPRP